MVSETGRSGSKPDREAWIKESCRSKSAPLFNFVRNLDGPILAISISKSGLKTLTARETTNFALAIFWHFCQMTARAARA